MIAPASFDPKVSVFPILTNSTAQVQLFLSKVCELIRSTKYAEKTKHIRSAYAKGGKETARPLKERLHSATLAGTFTRHAKDSWVVSSGCIQLDVDGLDDPIKLADARAKLVADPHIVLLFTSPSGAGLKAAVRVGGEQRADPEAYLRDWEAATRWLKDVHGLVNDPAAKDCSRLAFLCHDPDALFNDKAESLNLDPWRGLAQVKPVDAPDGPNAAGDLGKQMLRRPRKPYQHDRPLDEIEAQALRHVLAMPPSIDRQGGSDPCMAVARVVADGFALFEHPDRCMRVLMKWNELNAVGNDTERWTNKQLGHKLDSVIAVHPDMPMGFMIPAQRLVGPLRAVPAAELIAQYPAMRTPLVHGLLRCGETMNIVAAPKTGKTLLALSLALSLVNGKPWLGHEVEQVPVLYIDNELHGETAAARLRDISRDSFMEVAGLHVINLRGRLRPLPDMERELVELIKSTGAGLIVVDALYRMLPAGASENDNAAMADVFNVMDRIASEAGAAIVAIHHTSKGGQSEKGVTDVGAGAGSFARAADAHVILRQHEVDGAVVLEAATRSWVSPPAKVLRRIGMLWREASELDPTKLKGRKFSGAPSMGAKPDDLAAHIPKVPASVSEIGALVHAAGLSIGKDRLVGMLKTLVRAGRIVCEASPGRAALYGLEASPAPQGCKIDLAADYLRLHPDATNAEVAEATACDTKTVGRARGRRKVDEREQNTQV